MSKEKNAICDEVIVSAVISPAYFVLNPPNRYCSINTRNCKANTSFYILYECRLFFRILLLMKR